MTDHRRHAEAGKDAERDEAWEAKTGAATHDGRLKHREREVLIVAALPDDVVAAVEAAEYGTGPA